MPLDGIAPKPELVCCETCTYSFGEGAVGQCRRHAPGPAGFPVIFDNGWCGDHRMDPTRVKFDDDDGGEPLLPQEGTDVDMESHPDDVDPCDDDGGQGPAIGFM